MFRTTAVRQELPRFFQAALYLTFDCHRGAFCRKSK